MRRYHPSILLPQSKADAEKDLDSFKLTTSEKTELERFKRKDTERDFVQLEELAKTTSNAGVQYLMLDTSDLVAYVLNSKTLRPEIIPLFIERLLSFTTLPLLYTPYSALKTLILSPVVASDVNLFRQVWEAAVTLQLMEAVSQPLKGAALLATVLSKHSSGFNRERGPMSVETMLFILSYINKCDNGDFPLPVEIYVKQSLADHKNEIEAWVESNMPDYVGLPLSWVYECLDLYMEH